jgi:hypothetical protein
MTHTRIHLLGVVARRFTIWDLVEEFIATGVPPLAASWKFSVEGEDVPNPVCHRGELSYFEMTCSGSFPVSDPLTSSHTPLGSLFQRLMLTPR